MPSRPSIVTRNAVSSLRVAAVTACGGGCRDGGANRHRARAVPASGMHGGREGRAGGDEHPPSARHVLIVGVPGGSAPNSINVGHCCYHTRSRYLDSQLRECDCHRPVLVASHGALEQARSLTGCHLGTGGSDGRKCSLGGAHRRALTEGRDRDLLPGCMHTRLHALHTDAVERTSTAAAASMHD